VLFLLTKKNKIGIVNPLILFFSHFHSVFTHFSLSCNKFFIIQALWHSALSVRVHRYQKLQMMA